MFVSICKIPISPCFSYSLRDRFTLDAQVSFPENLELSAITFTQIKRVRVILRYSCRYTHSKYFHMFYQTYFINVLNVPLPY